MPIFTVGELEARGFRNIPYLAFDIGGVKYETYSHGRTRAEVIGGRINRIYEITK